jgi:hypothetical protein
VSWQDGQKNGKDQRMQIYAMRSVRIINFCFRQVITARKFSLNA